MRNLDSTYQSWMSYWGSTTLVGHYVFGHDEESYCGLISAQRLDLEAPMSRPCFYASCA